jgi:hypothetical protein
MTWQPEGLENFKLHIIILTAIGGGMTFMAYLVLFYPQQD